MRASLVILVFIAIFDITFGQTAIKDTIGYYHNGEIISNWKYIKRHEVFNGKTFLLQEEYNNGKIHKEYFKNNDSTFLYVEYYEQPDSNVEYRINSWGKIREGYVVVSNKQLKDTVTTTDPVTYEVHKFFFTLLLPIQNWIYYYPDGKTKAEGMFLNGLQHGVWKYYDSFQRLNQETVFSDGKIESSKYINQIEEKSSEITRKGISQIWIIPDPKSNGRDTSNSKFRDYKFMYKTEDIKGIGDVYWFNDNGILNYTKTKVVQTEYKEGEKGLLIIQKYDIVKESLGSWSLVKYHQVEIFLDNKRELFEIEYLSDDRLRLKKMIASTKQD